MANGKLIAGYIFAILAVLLIIIATIIVAILRNRYSDTDTKKRLTASTVITGLTAVFAIITAVVGILFARAKGTEGKQYKGLGIIFAILAAITLIMYATVIGLNLSVRSKEKVTNTDKNALLVTVIIIAAGFISLAVASVLFFTLTKGKSGKEALQGLKYERRTRRNVIDGDSSSSEVVVTREGIDSDGTRSGSRSTTTTVRSR